VNKFAAALKEGLERRFERRYPVELAKISGTGTKPGYVKVQITRPDGSAGEEKEVRSDFTTWVGLIVRVSTVRQKFGEEEEAIVGVDYDTYAASSTMPVLVGEHGQTHGYEQADEVSWLHNYQQYPLRVQAYSGMTVRVQPGLYYADGSWRILIDSLDVDTTPSKPGSDERWVLLTLTSTGSVTLTNGATAATVLRTSIPDPPTGEYPIAAIKITSSTTAITRSDIDDIRHLRPFVPDILPGLGSAFQRLRVNTGATALEFFTDQAGILVVIDGGGADITTGSKGYVTVPFDLNVVGWYILGDNTSNQIVIDVKLDAGFPAAGALPTTATIAGSEKPTLSSAASNSDLNLTTWTTQILAQGDVLEFNVDSVGGTKPQRVSLTLVVEKR
jgi:hypothetical protein